MIGCKQLDATEIETIETGLKNPRDRALFVLCLYTGFRIQEALSLVVRDVTSHSRVTVRRSNMKGKISSRSVLLHPRVAQAITELVEHENLAQDDYLFQSRKGNNQAISRVQAWRIIKDVVRDCKLDDKIATHSMRKTFADRAYKAFKGDIFKTSKALGHKSVLSTASYLSFKTEEIDAAIMGME